MKTALPKFLNTLGIKKALLVTGKTLYDKVRSISLCVLFALNSEA